MSESCRNGEDSLLLFLFVIIISSNFNIKLGHNVGTLITASHKAGALPSPPLSTIHSTSTCAGALPSARCSTSTLPTDSHDACQLLHGTAY